MAITSPIKPEIGDFPVFFPDIREVMLETGSPSTATPAINRC
jgi:hypothetical protein